MLHTPRAGAPLWAAAPHPRPAAGLSHRLTLALRPIPAEARYAVCTEWTEFVAGDRQRSRLARTVGLRVAAHPGGWRLALRTEALGLDTPDPTAFDEIGLLVGGLYADLVFDLAPTGALLALVNHADIRAGWPRLRQALRQRYPTPSALLDGLETAVARRLARPAGLWPSLALDYLYAALPGNFYAQAFDAGQPYTAPRAFPQFFDGLGLCFLETLRLAPPDPAAPDRARLHLTGAPDPAGPDADGAAAAARVAAALGIAVAPAEVRRTYAATHDFALSTGLPTAVELTVRCAYRDLYCKEYHLTVTPILPL
ncbi:hypothetical protein [Hymenobacter sp.]|uniref:hypothetical protein n=1 Tax=Hymenobacter sp. TaxID=1898978 RepID=UPI00286C907F|nr:hypothetical protein [Hymenobacter sp.]